MFVATRHARLAGSIIAPHAFGEAIVLPSGTVRGVVDWPGVEIESRPRGSNIGSRIALDHQQPPVLWLRTVDAAGLRERDSVTARGETWLVVSLTPDGAGMTEVQCQRPGAEPGPHPEFRRWR